MNFDNSDASPSPDDLAQLTEILRRIGPHARSRVFSGASLPSPPLEPNPSAATFPPASQHPSLPRPFQPTGSPAYSRFPEPAHAHQLLGNFQPVPLGTSRQSMAPNTSSAPRVSAYQSPRPGQPQGHPQSFSAAPGRQTLLFNSLASSQSQPTTPATSQLSRPPAQPARRTSGLSTQSVNRDRLNAAAAHQPASQRATRSSRRVRGSAAPPPGLNPRGQSIESCYVDLGHNLGIQLAITVKVYAPKMSNRRGLKLHHYRFHADSFDAFLERMHLVYRYNVPAATTSIVDVMRSVVFDMEQSEAAYQFSPGASGSILPHETLPLELLCFHDRGRTRPADGCIRLREEPSPRSLMLSDMVANVLLFSPLNLQRSVVNNRFVIYLIARCSPLLGRQPADDGSFPSRMHSCISKKMYNRFSTDEGVCGPGPLGFDDDTCSEASSSDSGDTEIIDTPDVLPLDISNRTANTAGLQRNSSIEQLPSSIWNTTWIPHPGSVPNRYNLENFSRCILEHANAGTPDSKLSITGTSMQDIVKNFINALKDAAAKNDFRKILSPNREFVIMQENPGGRDRLVSLGEGVEREVLWSAFSVFLAQSSKWLQPRVDDTQSIATTFAMRRSRLLSETRKQDLQVLGALASLLLINQIAPCPISPLLLHFLIHSSQLQCLHKNLVAEWHPELANTIQQWIDIGHTGDAQPFEAHFATYHDTQIACLQDRTEEAHAALSAEMLYCSIIGSESPNHPEIQAFFQGFKLPCQNGFCFIDAIKSFAGGSESLLSLLWTSHIKSYTDIQPYIRFRTPLNTTIVRNFIGIFPVPSLDELLVRFLKGAGVVCPGLFSLAQFHFASIVDLAAIDGEAFRSRMFCWAISGAPSIEIASASISVILASDDDPNYSPNSTPAAIALMLAEGRVGFRTCFKQAYFPASYLAALARVEYTGDSEPHSFLDAVDYWFLTEILNAIGSHTML